MTLTIRTPTTRLEGEDRRCWLEKTTPGQRRTVRGYEFHSYAPIRCIGHIDRKDCLFITLERWIDYPAGRRDIQRVELLLDGNGNITKLSRYPIEISKWSEPDQPAATAESEPQPTEPAAPEPEQPTIKNGDRIRFLDGPEHPELAGSEGTATRVGKMRLLANADKLGQAVSILLTQVQLVEGTPEPIPTATKPRRSRSVRSRAADHIAAPSA
jgi:hypothetical protein